MFEKLNFSCTRPLNLLELNLQYVCVLNRSVVSDSLRPHEL